MRPRPAILAVSLLVALAGCGGPTVPQITTESTTTQPTTATTTQPTTTTPPPTTRTTTAVALAPGVTTEAVVDAFALADAHRTTLRDTSFTVVEDRTVRYANGTLAAQRTTIGYVNASTSTVLVNTTSTDPGPSTYNFGNGTYVRWANATTALGYIPAAPEPYGKTASTWTELAVRATHWEDVASLLAGANTTVSVPGTGEDGLIRVFASSLATPSSVIGQPSQYAFSALVDERGVVHSFTLTYRTRLDGTTLYVTTVVRLTAIGETTVDRPPWVSAALDATA